MKAGEELAKAKNNAKRNNEGPTKHNKEHRNKGKIKGRKEEKERWLELREENTNGIKY